MASWAFHAYDLVSQQRGATLPVQEWSHTDLLNDSGSFTALLQARTPAMNRAALDTTLVGRSSILPTRNGVPLGYEGVVWTRDMPSLGGYSLLSYFDSRRFLASVANPTRSFSGVDQHMIIKELVDWAQANGPGIQIDTSQVINSGVLRDQTWSRWQAKSIGEAIRQKGDNLGGYDFDIRVELGADGLPIRRLRLWTPRRGRPFQPNVSPVFTWGGNLLDIPHRPEDATKMTTHAIGVGYQILPPPSTERLFAESFRLDLEAAGYPRLDGPILDASDINLLPTLQAHVDGRARKYGAATADEITLLVRPDALDWDLGDDCLIVIPPDRHPWIPDGWQEYRRIVGRKWTWRGGAERLEVIAGRLQ